MKKKMKRKNVKNEKMKNEKKRGPLTPIRNCGSYGTERSRSTLKIAKDTFQRLVEISMLSWDLDTEMNVTVWADTHSTRETKEVTG